MALVRVIHDPVAETLTVYFSEPQADQVCEEIGEGVILIKDRRSGEVIGFERLYFKAPPGSHTVSVETLTGDKSGS
jgi:uncharacterized protein YuzE